MADSIVVLTDNVSTVIASIDVASSTIVTSAVQGPAGISGANATISYIAGVALGGHRGVVLSDSTAIYADSTISSHANKLIGITASAVSSGSFANIQSSGELDGFSGLIVNAIMYLQTTGIINSNLPTSGFIQQVGIATSATKILINIQPILFIG